VARGEDDKLVVDHSGGWVGFQSYIVRFVDEGLTVVVLTNAVGGVEPVGLGRKVATLYR
jgi:hypothetical protein